jgi:capsular exopolysaccharide synthesis family protein
MSAEKELQATRNKTLQPGVPARPAQPVRKSRPAKKGRPETMADIFRAEGALGTEFRRICDRIGWVADGAEKPAGPRQIIITSSVVGEGKSTVASLLALTAAIYLNQKTLLLDGDLRRPMVHRLFRESLPGGLSDCLSGTASFDSCLRTTDVDKLRLLTAGTIVSDPASLLTVERWSDLIAEASFYFDRIVIDCAPIIPVNDAVILGRVVDGVLMVIQAGRTQREVAARAAEIARDSQLKLLGLVVNNLDEALPFYYNQKYYGYRYHPRAR